MARAKRDNKERRRRTRDRDEEAPRKRMRHLDGLKRIDPHDYELIRKFMTEHGKILPMRLTGATAKQQRQIKRLVRRLRVMGIVP